MGHRLVPVAAATALVAGLLVAAPSAAATVDPAATLLDAGLPAPVVAGLSGTERSDLAEALEPTAAADEVSVVTVVDGRPRFDAVEVAAGDAQDVADVLADQHGVAAAGVAQPVRVLADEQREAQWPLDVLEAESVRALLPAGDRPVVAVVDTGVLGSHPDLQAALLPGTDLTAPGDGRTDPHGHGTHVAGTIGAGVGNGIGVEGVLADVSILPVRVMDATGAGNTALTARGITWAADHGADVINLSLGGPGHDPTLEYAVDYAVSQGVTVVAATGNSGSTQPFYPAAYTRAVAVGATSSTDALASFSNTGPHVDLTAPGVGVLSTTIGTTRYGYKSGTSMATPHVAAVLAGLGTLHPHLTPAQLQTHLQDTAVDLGPTGFDPAYGHGRIDAHAAYTTTPAGKAVAPGVPLVAQPTAGDASLRVAWSAPAELGTHPLSGYRVTATPTTGTARAVTVTTAAVTRTATLPGLVNGVAHRVTVQAVSPAGTSVASAAVTATPRTTPSAPALTKVTADNGFLGVYWNAPTGTGGAPVTGYTVTLRRTGYPTTSVKVAATARSVGVRGLVNGAGYSVRVQAVNAAGVSAVSNAVVGVPRTVPTAPRSPRTGSGSTSDRTYSVNTAWDAPASHGGATVSAYTVRLRRAGTSTDVVRTTTGGVRSVAFTGLVRGAAYTVTVQAHNVAGAGPVSVRSAAAVAR